MGVFGGVRSQLGSLARHAVGKMASEPMEMAKSALGVQSQAQNGGEDQGMEMMEKGSVQAAQQSNQVPSNKYSGFATKQHFDKYVDLSGKKDNIEINMLRRQLHKEYGIDADVESGMKRALMEREQREEQRNQVEERQKEEKEQVEEIQKEREDAQVLVAKRQGGAETGAGAKIAG